jgi:hypothetical protein
MKYELTLLESMATNDVAGEPEQESTRIKDVFLTIAFSRKKKTTLQRYFRIHREGINTLSQNLRANTLTQRKKKLLAFVNHLADRMDGRLKEFLEQPVTDDADIDSKKLITSLNLEELGVLIRLYIDTGLLRVRNRKALTRLLSGSVAVRTKQVLQDFSADHLYNAIHSPSAPAMNKVQKMLNDMLIHLNKLYREKRRNEKS